MRKSHAPYMILGLWALTLAVVASLWMSAHLMAFAPETLRLRGLASSGDRLTLHHFLSSECNCSRGVLNYLQSRGPSSHENEVIHLIGKEKSWDTRLRERGYQVELLNEEEAVARYRVQSVPQLLILSAGLMVYQGGYNSNQSHDTVYRDLEIAKELRANVHATAQNSATYPLFGCANGRMRRAKVDPLGMKYEN